MYLSIYLSTSSLGGAGWDSIVWYSIVHPFPQIRIQKLSLSPPYILTSILYKYYQNFYFPPQIEPLRSLIGRSLFGELGVYYIIL